MEALYGPEGRIYLPTYIGGFPYREQYDGSLEPVEMSYIESELEHEMDPASQ